MSLQLVHLETYVGEHGSTLCLSLLAYLFIYSFIYLFNFGGGKLNSAAHLGNPISMDCRRVTREMNSFDSVL